MGDQGGQCCTVDSRRGLSIYPGICVLFPANPNGCWQLAAG